MHIGGVSIFEGPMPDVRGPARDGHRQARPRPSLPPEGPARAARRRPPGVGRRPPLQPRLPRAPHRAPDARRRRAAAQTRRPRVLPAPRPPQAVVGAVGRRGAERNRWALLSKVHHCMVDGVAATDLMSVMFSDTTSTEAERPAVLTKNLFHALLSLLHIIHNQ